jgi:hypothetical protein
MPKLHVWTAAALAGLLALSGCKGNPKPKASPSPVAAAFSAEEVRALDPSNRPEATQRATEEASRVVTFLNSYYDIAFVKPSAWQKGTHPGLSALFTSDAASNVTSTLQALALGDAAPKIKSVKLAKQSATLSFEVESDLSMPFVFVTVAFEAKGATVAKSDGPVTIVHNATYLLQREGDSYKIAAYDAEERVDTVVHKAALGNLPAGWRV